MPDAGCCGMAGPFGFEARNRCVDGGRRRVLLQLYAASARHNHRVGGSAAEQIEQAPAARATLAEEFSWRGRDRLNTRRAKATLGAHAAMMALISDAKAIPACDRIAIHMARDPHQHAVIDDLFYTRAASTYRRCRCR